MGPAAPNDKCQHSNLCKRATDTMNSSVNQWALANPSSTSWNKPNLPPTGATKISAENYQSSKITSNHPPASAATMTLANQSNLFDHLPLKAKPNFAMHKINKYFSVAQKLPE